MTRDSARRVSKPGSANPRVRIEQSGQTASEHCLHQCGVKPTVSDRLNSSHINGLILCTGGLMLPLRGLVTRRADIIGIQSVYFRIRVKDVLTRFGLLTVDTSCGRL